MLVSQWFCHGNHVRLDQAVFVMLLMQAVPERQDRMLACWSYMRSLLLLLTIMAGRCMAAQAPLPLKTDTSPTSKFSTFQAALSSYVQDLNSQVCSTLLCVVFAVSNTGPV
jgi:hypothetical protein